MSQLDDFIDYSLAGMLGKDPLKEGCTEDQIIFAMDIDKQRKIDKKVQVLCWMYEGYTEFEISKKLNVTERTIRNYVRDLKRRFRR